MRRKRLTSKSATVEGIDPRCWDHAVARAVQASRLRGVLRPWVAAVEAAEGSDALRAAQAELLGEFFAHVPAGLSAIQAHAVQASGLDAALSALRPPLFVGSAVEGWFSGSGTRAFRGANDVPSWRYVILNPRGFLYCGSTADLRGRLRAHHRGSASRITRALRGPWWLLDARRFDSRREAVDDEARLLSDHGAQALLLASASARLGKLRDRHGSIELRRAPPVSDSRLR